MLMAAARVNIPAIAVTAGPMMAGQCACIQDELLGVADRFRQAGKADMAKVAERLATGHTIYGVGYYGAGWH